MPKGQDSYEYCLFIGNPMGFNHQRQVNVSDDMLNLKEGVTNQKLNRFVRGYDELFSMMQLERDRTECF